MEPVHIGCSGWSYRAWRGVLYPQQLPTSRWLERYAECFDTVEVNATFYRLPNRDAVANWVKQTPASFTFCVKASRYLTHVRRLADMASGVERFYERIEPLQEAGRLGPLLWQLPANFRRDDQRLQAALDALPAGLHAFEFRDPSWFAPEVLAMLRAAGAALVIGDHPERPFRPHEATAPWMLVRFHYGHRGRDGNYSPTELDEWAARIDRWRREHAVYAYFNNDWRGFAPRNALALRKRLELSSAARHAPRRSAPRRRSGPEKQR
jgi:uncharacterized protein YecE (DUF72 family)